MAPKETWEDIEDLTEAGEAIALQEYVEALPPGEPARVMAYLKDDDQAELLTMLDEEGAARLLDSLPDFQAAQAVMLLPVKQAAHIVDCMESDEQVDLLEQLSDARSEAILEQMEDEESARFLSRYAPDTAGGLMITEFLAYAQTLSVGDLLTELREGAEQYARYNIQYVYVVDAEEKLRGVLKLRDLVMSSPTRPIAELMIAEPTSILDTTTLNKLKHVFDHLSLFGLPVVDSEAKLLGVVRRADVEEAAEEQAGRTFLRFAGILGGEELRSMPLHVRCGRRLSWLSINIMLNVLAASVIAFYQDTLAAVIALAVFLPIVSDMSGCSGNQAVAVSIRELVLGTVRPRDFFRVFFQEASLGIINGLVLGLLLGVVGFVWQGNFALGLVVGSALALNTVFAVSLGSLIPLVLQGAKIDPALASGPLLTTLTDMCGFFLVLSLAQLAMPYLV